MKKLIVVTLIAFGCSQVDRPISPSDEKPQKSLSEENLRGGPQWICSIVFEGSLNSYANQLSYPECNSNSTSSLTFTDLYAITTGTHVSCVCMVSTDPFDNVEELVEDAYDYAVQNAPDGCCLQSLDFTLDQFCCNISPCGLSLTATYACLEDENPL